MKNALRQEQNLIESKENIFNSRDIKLQILTLYQIVYWGIILLLKLLPLKVETDLKNLIIVVLSCISVILILVVIFDALLKKKYKWSGVLILFLTSTVMLLFEYIM